MVTAPPKRTKGTKPATEVARQLFLYGEGDGVRILDAVELAKKSGVHRETIRQRMPEWLAELESKLSNTSKLACNSQLSVPDEVLEQNRADISFFRGRLDKTMAELTDLPHITAALRQDIANCAGDSDQIDHMMTLLDRYLRISANEKSLTKMAIELKSLWDAKSGIDSLKNIQEATAKAVSLSQAKTSGAGPEEKPAETSDGVFRLK